MDAIVEAALRKWPRVPHCHGWLALDARGDWYMRDERIQAAGPFPRPKGSRIEHAQLRAFIERNYGRDEAGAWYFQNGPQRVYVELEAAPWVWRVAAQAPGDGAAAWPVHSHTGLPAEVSGCWLDDAGRLFLDTDLGLGIVHTLDMGVAAMAVEAGDWRPVELPFAAIPGRFGYVLQPRP
ncbi:MAG: DUF2946 domain-containing protein [Leptothrix sp. (in: Bacteria)]|nr:DUF2946 domain-containing protein [Leptothrix sp. (in: b-proteobacteria)]